jgi:hypothetical protein
MSAGHRAVGTPKINGPPVVHDPLFIQLDLVADFKAGAAVDSKLLMNQEQRIHEFQFFGIRYLVKPLRLRKPFG